MANSIVVAVYETAANAEAAAADLRSSGIAESAIHQFDRQHPAWDKETAATDTRRQSSGGFWSWLFGPEENEADDHLVYEDTVNCGGTVLSVTAPEAEHDRVIAILERHNPADMDDRSRTLAATPGPDEVGATSATLPSRASPPAFPQPDARSDAVGLETTGEGEQVIPLVEEQLQVGKRMVETGRTRIRRYVIETPVEERVRLRTERVVIERRRPVTGDTVSPDAFTETTTEITERTEQPVVQKTTRVGEEVVVKTEVTDREETVHDKVRKQEVDVSRAGEIAEVNRSSGRSSPVAKPSTNP